MKNKHWSTGKAIRGHFMLFLIIGIALTALSINLVDKLLTGIVPEWSAPIFLGICIVLGFFISANITRIIFNFRDRNVPLDSADSEYIKMDSHFKWHLIYSIAIAWFIYIVLQRVCYPLLRPLIPENFVTLFLFGFLAITYLLMWLIIRKFHHFMARKTHTNEKLILEILDGKHMDEVPENLRDSKSLSTICNLILECTVSSVPMAVWLVKIGRMLKKAGKIYLIIVGVLAAVMTFATVKTVNYVDKAVRAEVKALRDDIINGIRYRHQLTLLADEMLRQGRLMDYYDVLNAKYSISIW